MSSLYFKLMSAPSVLVDENQICSSLEIAPSTRDGLFHYLWAINALTRYLAFVRLDLDQAEETLLSAVPLAAQLFSFDFNDFDLERKTFLPLLALNFSRLANLRGRFDKAESMALGLRNFLRDLDPKHLSTFPDVLREALSKHSIEISATFNEDNREYFFRKLRRVRERAFVTQARAFESLPRLLDERALRFEDEVAFIDADTRQTCTWGELKNKSEALAALLPPSRSVVICVGHDLLWPVSLLACWRSGRLPVLIHDESTERDLADLTEALGEESPPFIIQKTSMSTCATLLKNSDETLIAVEYAQLSTPNSPSVDVKPSAPALGLLTSGSSGKPKLVVFTHANLLAAAHIESENEARWRGAKIANLRPPFTSGGLNTLWPSFIHGASHVFSESLRKRPIGRFLEGFLKANDPQLLVASPSFLQALLANEAGAFNHKARVLYYGGMSLPRRSVERLQENQFSLEMRYGMTEVGHIISKKNLSIDAAASDVGLPLAGFKVRVADGRLAICSDGAADYQMARGQFLALKNEEWLLTDDRATLSNSSIILEGREHQIINVSGFRFHASQVEVVLHDIPGFKDARVVGIPDPVTGQKLVALAVARPDLRTPLESEARRFCQLKLSSFKRPTKYVWLQSWPYLANGKIDWAFLKAAASDEDKGIADS